jgi:hypothetical protein
LVAEDPIGLIERVIDLVEAGEPSLAYGHTHGAGVVDDAK